MGYEYDVKELYDTNKLARLSRQIFHGQYINPEGTKICCRECKKEFDISSNSLNQEDIVNETYNHAMSHIKEGLLPFIKQMEKEEWSSKKVTISYDTIEV